MFVRVHDKTEKMNSAVLEAEAFCAEYWAKFSTAYNAQEPIMMASFYKESGHN